MDGRVDEMLTRTAGGDVLAAARAVAEGAARRAAGEDHDGGFPAEDIAALARSGLLAAPVPRDMGGLGLGEEPEAATLRAVLTRVGYGSLALGRVYEGHVNALQLIARTSAGGCSPTRMTGTCSAPGTPSRRGPASTSAGTRTGWSSGAGRPSPRGRAS